MTTPAQPANVRNHERDAAMASLYATGATLEEIGDAFGITRERVRQIIRREGVPRRSRLATDPMHVLRAARAPAVSQVSHAARQAGTDPRVVEEVLRQLGCWPAVRRLWRWRRDWKRRQERAAWIERYRARAACLGRPLTSLEILRLRAGNVQKLFGRNYIAKIRAAVGETVDVRARRYVRPGTLRAAILRLAARPEGVRARDVVAATGTTRGCAAVTIQIMRRAGVITMSVSRRGLAGESTYVLARTHTDGAA